MKPDPIELELFRHLLVSIAEEMGAVLRKTSYSANIKERRDYSCAVYDAAGETVAMGDHMPVHLGAMPLSVRHAMEAFDLAPGDVAILNDPFRGGTHLPDITAVSGVFVKGSRKPAFYVANRAHHADVGGMSPGSMPLAREIYQEGIRIPPILLARGGQFDRDLLDLILANVRTPEEREGDLLAQMHGDPARRAAAARAGGEVRDDEGAAQHDRAQGLQRAHDARRHPAAAARASIASKMRWITTESADRPVKIAVTVTIHGDRATIDFTGSSAQVEGSVNANYAVAISATTYVFRCLVREDIPYTAGVMRPLEVIAPERIGGERAASGGDGRGQCGNIAAHHRRGAGRAGAGRAGTDSGGQFRHHEQPHLRRHGSLCAAAPFAYYETIAGGMGASAVSDGPSATHTHMTNSWNTPVEAFEHQYPLRIRGYRIRSGSGGRGKTSRRRRDHSRVRISDPADVTILSDRRLRGPYGLAGGRSGRAGEEYAAEGKAHDRDSG